MLCFRWLLRGRHAGSFPRIAENSKKEAPNLGLGVGKPCGGKGVQIGGILNTRYDLIPSHPFVGPDMARWGHGSKAT